MSDYRRKGESERSELGDDHFPLFLLFISPFYLTNENII